MTATLPPRPGAPAHRRTVGATVAGNLVEHFDWLGFALFAPIFATQFFPSADPVNALLSIFAVFAAGMFFRPLGGILLGRYADRRGRKPAMLAAIVLMGGGCVLIGLAPTYDQIGVAAPLLLVVGRAAQGLSAGGEWPAAVTYLMELAPAARRCFYSSLFAMSAVAGALIASLLGAGLSTVLSPAALTAWGWRVPFLLGGVFAAVLLGYRRRLAESAVFERTVRESSARGSFRQLLRVHWRSLLLATVFSGGTTWTTSTWISVIPAMGQRNSSPGTMFWVVVLATAVAVVIQLPLGMLADRIGVRPLLAASVLGFAIVGPFAFLGMGSTFGGLLFSYGSGVLFIACLTAVLPKIMAAMYPAEVRAMGIGLPQGITTALFGGTSPWVATYLTSRGAGAWFMATVVVAVLVAWLAASIAVRRFVTAGPPVAVAADGGDATELRTAA